MYRGIDYTGLYITIGLAVAILLGVLCSRLAAKRGYPGNRFFWLGFFLGLIGLVYVLGLPIKTTIESEERQSDSIPPFEAEPRTPRETWQNGKYPAAIVALRLTYMGGYTEEFINRVGRLLENGYSETDLYASCVDDGMKQWLTDATKLYT